MANASEIWCLLTSHGKLERDRGVDLLKEICNSYNAKPDTTIKSCILTSNPPFDELLRTTFEKLVQYPICLNETPWETKIGILTGCQVLYILKLSGCFLKLPCNAPTYKTNSLVRS